MAWGNTLLREPLRSTYITAYRSAVSEPWSLIDQYWGFTSQPHTVADKFKRYSFYAEVSQLLSTSSAITPWPYSRVY